MKKPAIFQNVVAAWAELEEEQAKEYYRERYFKIKDLLEKLYDAWYFKEFDCPSERLKYANVRLMY